MRFPAGFLTIAAVPVYRLAGGDERQYIEDRELLQAPPIRH
jgi:hypothetical protein